ncbi:hypothetical protein DEJ48_01600 [Streptomyces venezuelae]|uniref:Lipoprotein n=1 Tax=Streptomyces venezuelae TaxID=54571 RepID=A0A5P2BQQ1_STRVZ|nr:GerMN domain-containing protein [Streptomyces venezuelae]QES32280.1 hypothetical protein DEJ48_01600 [Streptomyces venezuelae]
MRTPHPCVPLLALVPLLVATGCGVSTTAPQEAGAPASGIQRPGTSADHARLYFVGPYGLRATTRPTDRPLLPQQAIDLLLEGPTEAERQRGLISEVPAMNGRLTATAATAGTVDIYLPVTVAELQIAAVSQLACTAAYSDVPGDRPPTTVDIRFHENLGRSPAPWTVRCDADGNAHPLTEGAPR